MRVTVKVQQLRVCGAGSLRGPGVSFLVKRVKAQKSERVKQQNGPPRWA